MDGDSHRSVEVVEYDFVAGPTPSVRYTRTDGLVTSESVVCDVYVTSDRGFTIDKLSKQPKRG